MPRFRYELTNNEMLILDFMWLQGEIGVSAYEIKGWLAEEHNKNHHIQEIHKMLLELNTKGYVDIRPENSGYRYYCRYGKEDFLHNLSRMLVNRYFQGSVWNFLNAYAGEIDLEDETLKDYKKHLDYAKKRRDDGIAAAKERGVRFGRPKKYEPENYFYLYEKYRNDEITQTQAIDIIGCTRSTYYGMMSDFKRMYLEKYGTP